MSIIKLNVAGLPQNGDEVKSELWKQSNWVSDLCSPNVQVGYITLTPRGKTDPHEIFTFCIIKPRASITIELDQVRSGQVRSDETVSRILAFVNMRI